VGPTANIPSRRVGVWRRVCDERRVVAGDGRVRHSEPPRPWSRRAPRAFAKLARNGQCRFAPACSSPPSVALLPRVAACSSMSGASLPATRRAARGRSSNPQARRSATSVRVPGRVVRRRGVRQVGARTDHALSAPACSSRPSITTRPRVAARSAMSGAPLRRRGLSRNPRPVPSGQRGSAAATKLDLERMALASRRRVHRRLRLRCARA
jgi:hypothetical protein